MLEHMFERVNPPERHDFRHCRPKPWASSRPRVR